MRPLGATIIAALMLAACGGSSSGLTNDQQYRVAHANLALATFCLDEAKGSSVPASEFAAQSDAIDTLTTVFRENPKGLYGPGGTGHTMRQVLADQANSLQDCSPDDAAQLDRTLAAG